MTSPEAHMHAWKERLAALARHPLALPTLFVVALVEASLIPIPPDMLLIPLALARPRRTFLIATVCIAGSVTGAMIGYAIGATLFDSVGEKFVAALGVAARTSATKSAMVKSISWPTAEITGTADSKIARATISSLNAHKSSSDPPPRVTKIRSRVHGPEPTADSPGCAADCGLVTAD